MKTICIAGKNDIAVDIMLYCKNKYKRHRIIVVTDKSEKGVNCWQKSLKWFAERNKIEIVKLQEVYTIENLLFLSTEFDQIIKPNCFKTEDLYNIHFSMLPKYKGCFPSVLPILNGESSTGVTLHKMRCGIDTGEIVDQSEVIIEEDDSSLDLYKKLMHAGTELLIRNIDSLISGSVAMHQQGKINSSYYPRDYINYSNVKLETNATAFQIKNQIRAFSFRPYQLMKWNGTSYIDSKITDATSLERPGSVLEDTDLFTKISSIDYDIILFKDTFYEALELVRKRQDASRLCITKKIIESIDEHGWSLLTVAVYNNNLPMVKWLVANGANINIVNNNGTTLLMYAKDCFINYKNADVFEYLMTLNTNIKQQDFNGKTLYDYCREQGIDMIGKYNML